MNVISVRNLVKHFKIRKRSPGIFSAVSSFINFRQETIKAIDGISFDISKGELVGFIGPNGAGKTTTLKSLSGLLYPTEGAIKVLGYTPFQRKTEYLKKISLVMGQKHQLVWDLPSIETYRLNQAIYDIEEKLFKSNLKILTKLLEVEELLSTPVRQLSLGQRMKMELIATLLHNPKVLFLDEPTIGLDVVMQEKIRNFIAEYNFRFRSTILLTSHYMTDVKKLCKRVIVIDRGKIIYDGNLSSLVEKYSSYKIVTVIFDGDINRKKISKLGQIKKIEGQKAVLTVSRDKVNYIAAYLLDKFRVDDLNIEEPEIEEIIRLVFKKKNDN